MAKSNSQVSTLDDDEVAVAAPTAANLGTIKSTGEDIQLSGKKQTLTIHATDSIDGQEAVFIGLNGYGYHIPRGVPVAVPVEVVEILANAKTDHLRATQGGGTEVRTSQRFAFTAM